MRRLACFAVLLFAIPCVAQYPDVDALLELALTTDPAVVARHLPVELMNAVNQLAPKDQIEFERGLMIMEKTKNEHVAFVRSEVPPALVEIKRPQDPADEVGTVYLDKRISDGYESILLLRFKTSARDIPDDAALLVWMRFEEGEWRLLEIQPVEGHDRLNFADTSVLEKFRAHNNAENEAAAVGSLRTYNTALVTYSSAYADLGFPSRLEALGGSEQENVSADRAGLVDDSLSKPPFEKSGYRFTYRPVIEDGKVGAYALVGRPITYGEGSKRSFFTDQSGVIRSTEEDREPTAADPPLQ